MSIGNIELNTAMTGINDYVSQRQNEQAKPMVDQTNFENQFQQEVNSKLTNVQRRDDMDNHQRKFNASDKGDNEYAGDGGKNRKKKDDEKKSEGKVVSKGYSSFDIKI